MLPKRLSTHRRPLHASPTLRSETVTRMAHQAAANPTQSFAIPALHLEAASVVRTGRRSRNKVLAGLAWCKLCISCRESLWELVKSSCGALIASQSGLRTGAPSIYA